MVHNGIRALTVCMDALMLREQSPHALAASHYQSNKSDISRPEFENIEDRDNEQIDSNSDQCIDDLKFFRRDSDSIHVGHQSRSSSGRSSTGPSE